MTVAVCIKCGATKRGALTQCVECRFFPHGHEDIGRSMILTDHFLSKEDLKAISARIQSGQQVSYPEDQVQEYAEIFAQIQDVEVSPWTDILLFAFALAVVGLAGFIVWWVFH